MNFTIGKVYSRNSDIHKKHGGQERGGISTPSESSFIFLFTGKSGDAFGYKDEFKPDGCFLYTGEGQVGDMSFIRGNRAIVDHEKNSKRLLLFETPKKGKAKFIGESRLIGFHREERPDRTGKLRSAIIFELEILTEGESSASHKDESSFQNESSFWKMDMNQLKALASQNPPPSSNQKVRKQYVRCRSEAVRIYVLRRAGGICELCEKAAPFKTKKRKPYLEPHHLTRLADGGPDHPSHVAACCPNCHREIHFGKDGETLNEGLREKITFLEK